MKFFHHHKVILFLLTFFLVTAMMLLIVALQQQQPTNTHAQKSTTLLFRPESTLNAPIVKLADEDIPLDVIVKPGDNLVTVVHLVVTFDPSLLQADTSQPFVANTSVFPAIIEGPFVSPGKVSLTLSIGSDPTKAISKDTKAGTLHLKGLAPTGDTPTMVTIASSSEVLSSGVNDQATENVLNTRVPAYVRIDEDNPNGNTNFTINLLLHGIGHSGDNPNPTAYSLSNQHPQRKERPVSLEILNGTNHELVGIATGTVTYDETNGNFTGNAAAANRIKPGQYLVKIHSDYYLRKYVPGIITVANKTTVVLPQLSLVTSDNTNDNKLNILDYNMILDCYTGSMPARACDDTDKQTVTDANDDGFVNQYDYNLFLRELSVQNGD